MSTVSPERRLQALTLPALLDAVFSVYARNFWLFVVVVAATEIPYNLLSAGLGLTVLKPPAGLGGVQGRLTNAQAQVLIHWLLPALGIAVALVLVAGLVVLPVQEAAVTKVIADRYLDRSTSFRRVYGYAFSRWLPLLGLILLLGGAALLAMSALVGAGLILHLTLGVAGALVELLLVVAALVAAVMVAVRLSVVVPALVMERAAPRVAIRRAWALTQGGAWRALGVILTLALIAGIAAFFLGLLAGALGSLAGGTGHFAGAALDDLGSTAAAILVAPVPAAGLVLLYFDFRVRKEGFDLNLLSDHLAP